MFDQIKRRFINLAENGLALTLAKNQLGIFQLLEMMRNRRMRYVKLLAGLGETLFHGNATGFRFSEVVEHPEDFQPLFAGKGLENFRQIRLFHNYRIV